MTTRSYLYFFALIWLFGCEESEKLVSFSNRIDQGSLTNNAIDEASGLADSQNYAQALWTHNDSGDEARIFLIQQNASSIATFNLENITNRDWEDIASARISNINHLFVADIGDNNLQYDKKYLYYFPEPVLAIGSGNPTLNIDANDITTITFSYPDEKKDAEALMIDETSNEFYILSKEDSKATLYKATIPAISSEITLTKVATLPFDKVTAADISPDGLEVLVKTYSNVYYWKRQNLNTLIEDLLQTTPIKLLYSPEPQGEAIAWKKDLSGYFTLSEKSGGITPRLYFYQRQ